MKKEGTNKARVIAIVITIAAIALFFFVIIPISLISTDGETVGNVAVIPIEGPITSDGSDYLGTSTVSSQTIVNFLQKAEQNEHIQVIVLEINSPGGSAVASDEIATAVKASQKPVVTIVREVAASGGYWIASASDYIIANKMSITGSIGVISSYLEFSGLFEKYGVSYERLIAGKYKDLGTPYKSLSPEEHNILQKKLDTIHTFFIQEVAENRQLSETKVRELVTGEFFLGVEALNLGLIDQLGNQQIMEEYIQETYNLETIHYVRYQREYGFLELLTGVFSKFSFNIGEGIASLLVKRGTSIMLV